MTLCLLGGINTFAYAAANPSGLTDPSGLIVPAVAIAIGASMGAYQEWATERCKNPNATTFDQFRAAGVGAFFGGLGAGGGPLWAAFRSGAFYGAASSAFNGWFRGENPTEIADSAVTNGAIGAVSGGLANAAGIRSAVSLARRGMDPGAAGRWGQEAATVGSGAGNFAGAAWTDLRPGSCACK